MLTKNQLQTILLTRDNATDSMYRVYCGIDTLNCQLLINDDGSYPYVRSVNARTEPLLAMSPEYQVTTESYRVTLISETPPNPNLSWWISKDGGTTKIPVNFVRREERVERSHWWVFLSLN